MDIVLHHFDASPFAEKIRLIMGLKGLVWRSVQIPMVMPKPDLTALTGGYRKTPVMQVGAEIYCDTRRIARELERRFPEPTLFPDGHAGMAMALGVWSDTRFFEPGAALAMGVNEAIPDAILKDRFAFFNFMDFSTLPAQVPHLYGQMLAQAELVEEQLSDGRPFLFGDAPGWADIHAWFVVWMCRGNIAPVARYFAPYGRMAAWERRMAGIGHGTSTAMDAGEALAIARATPAAPGAGVAADDPLGFAAGDEVIVEPDDYGRVPVRGRLVTLNRREIAINRDDDRAGNVNVHFPRAGYRVRRAD
jgi:glutathione S-transferase